MGRLAIFGLLIISLFGCKSAQEMLTDEPTFKSNSPQNLSPQIVIINFSINSLDTVLLNNTLVNVGRIRQRESLENPASIGDILVTIVSETGDQSTKTLIPNPLKMKVEYAKKEGSGELKAETVSLSEAIFFIRIQYEPWFSQIRVEKLINDQFILLKTIPFIKPDLK